MIVVDTSVWIEWLRGGKHPVAATLDALLEVRADLAITESVLMEVLAGAPSGLGLERARRRLTAFAVLPLAGRDDFEEAARIYRACRDGGHTIRSQLDLLVAVPTIRHGASLLHNDRDFEVIARHSALKLEPLVGSSGNGGHQIRERAGRYTRGSRTRSTRTRSRNSRTDRLASKA